MNISQQQLSETILRPGPYLRTLRDDLEKGNILRLEAQTHRNLICREMAELCLLVL